MAEELVPHEVIENNIYLIRGQKVMLDKDLAELYGVKTTYLNQQVGRNIERFPQDFMFQLNKEEYKNLKCNFCISSSEREQSNLKLQNATSSSKMQSKEVSLKSQIVISRWGGTRKLPYVFTEQGVAMLSSVLNSDRAILVNIAIMRAFVRLRQIIANNKELSNKIDLLEKRVFKHDSDIRELVRDIRKLTITKSLNRGKVGFLK